VATLTDSRGGVEELKKNATWKMNEKKKCIGRSKHYYRVAAARGLKVTCERETNKRKERKGGRRIANL